jgi:hypothetical protein
MITLLIPKISRKVWTKFKIAILTASGWISHGNNATYFCMIRFAPSLCKVQPEEDVASGVFEWMCWNLSWAIQRAIKFAFIVSKSFVHRSGYWKLSWDSIPIIALARTPADIKMVYEWDVTNCSERVLKKEIPVESHWENPKPEIFVIFQKRVPKLLLTRLRELYPKTAIVVVPLDINSTSGTGEWGMQKSSFIIYMLEKQWGQLKNLALDFETHKVKLNVNPEDFSYRMNWLTTIFHPELNLCPVREAEVSSSKYLRLKTLSGYKNGTKKLECQLAKLAHRKGPFDFCKAQSLGTQIEEILATHR